MLLSELLLNDEKSYLVQSEEVIDNPNMISFSMPKETTHWLVTLWRGDDWMQFYFSKGPGHRGKEPTLNEVLECLSTDASMYENSQNLDDWMEEFGFQTDSISERRKYERTYNVLGELSRNLKSLFGDELYEKLLWEVEFD